jgi:hypothetical protein
MPMIIPGSQAVKLIAPRIKRMIFVTVCTVCMPFSDALAPAIMKLTMAYKRMEPTISAVGPIRSQRAIILLVLRVGAGFDEAWPAGG